MNIFRSSIALSTAMGIEVMSLDKKLPFSIPDLKATDVKPIVRTGPEVWSWGYTIDEDKESRELCRWEGGPAI